MSNMPIPDPSVDHKRLYDIGILQRDVSPNNLLIVPSWNSDFSETTGQLIDFDHASHTASFTSPQAINYEKREFARKVNQGLEVGELQGILSDDVVEYALGRLPVKKAMAYLEDVIKSQSEEVRAKNPRLSDLGWDIPVGLDPTCSYSF